MRKLKLWQEETSVSCISKEIDVLIPFSLMVLRGLQHLRSLYLRIQPDGYVRIFMGM